MCANRIFYGTEAISKIEKNSPMMGGQWLTEKEIKEVKKISMWKISKESFDIEALHQFKNLEILEISGLYEDKPLIIQNLKLLYKMKKLRSIRLVCCDLGEGLDTSHWKKLKSMEVSQCKMESLTIARNRRLKKVICEKNTVNTENQTDSKKIYHLHERTAGRKRKII